MRIWGNILIEFLNTIKLCCSGRLFLNHFKFFSEDETLRYSFDQHFQFHFFLSQAFCLCIMFSFLSCLIIFLWVLKLFGACNIALLALPSRPFWGYSSTLGWDDEGHCWSTDVSLLPLVLGSVCSKATTSWHRSRFLVYYICM